MLLEQFFVTLQITCSDDKTVRLWDTVSGSVARQITLDSSIGGFELEKDYGDILTVAHGKAVSFYNSTRYDLEFSF